MSILGISDGWILLAYGLCLLSMLFCVVYGLCTWNSDGDTAPTDEDAQWAKAEDEIIEKL